MIDLYDAMGLAGVCISTYSYARVQWQRDFAKTIQYSTYNFLATLLMFFSLADKWNLASFVSNCAWALISGYGIYRCLKYWWRRRKEQAVTTVPPTANS